MNTELYDRLKFYELDSNDASSFRRVRRALSRHVDKALDRLNLDEYGYCETCGVEIGLRRLEARPTAELCIDCKHLEEQKEKSQAA